MRWCACFDALKLVAVIDKKADVNTVDARLAALKRATDDAIRKRVRLCLCLSLVLLWRRAQAACIVTPLAAIAQCKKTAVDNEIAALHDVLQRQQEAVETRLDDALARASALSESHAQNAVQAFAQRQDDERCEWQREYEERCVQHTNTQFEQLEQSLRQHLEHHLTTAVAAAHDSSVTAASKWWREEQQKLQDLHERHVLSVHDEQEQSHQRVKEELEHQVQTLLSPWHNRCLSHVSLFCYVCLQRA